MKRNSAEIKRIARESLMGHWGLPIGAMAVIGLIITVISLVILLPISIIMQLSRDIVTLVIFYCASFAVSLLISVLTGGLLCIHLKLSRREVPSFGDLFYCFIKRPHRFILAALLQMLISIFCILPSEICIALMPFVSASAIYILMPVIILLLLGGITLNIIITIHFALVFLLLTDRDSLGVIDAFQESVRLMHGNKGRYFYIILSFIGWILLCVLSCYIGLLWVGPYMIQTTVTFYRELIGELS